MYPIHGVKNKLAGIQLSKDIRDEDPLIPIIIQSTDVDNEKYAQELNTMFLHKNSKTFHSDLRKKITDNFSFGDYRFIHPVTGVEEFHVKRLRDMQDCLFKLTDETFFYHVSRNNISRWLYSRAMFPLAEFVKNTIVQSTDPKHLQNLRQVIFDAILQYRKIKNRGVVAVFQRDRFDEFSNFARIGEGSLGGKGRGLAFVDAMIKHNDIFEKFENTEITIPKTVVLCTDNFSEFMELNKLYPLALSDIDNEEVLEHFLKAKIPRRLVADLLTFLGVVNSPVAVRSSSLLEDSHYQPFAGIYSTYMVPYNATSKTQMLSMILESVKAVYASVFFRESKAYMSATKNVIDEEKMAVVLQEICGNSYGNRYYPSFSGVARSLNYYPIGNEKPEDGIANIAMGLGKYIVDGGLSLRFSPSHPHNILQTSTLDFALRETQTHFNALDLNVSKFVPQVDDGFNLLKINVQDALQDGTLQYIASTFSVDDQVLFDSLYEGGRKVITFANILEHGAFPLADCLKQILITSQEEMGRPVEIEFCVNLDYTKDKPKHIFYLLQIRPIVDTNENINEDIGAIADENTIISSNSALGHGFTNDVYDLIYVKPELFSAANNQLIMYDIEKINKILGFENKRYVLVGPGRWGSSDPWLGIPVKWPHISNAKVIVESGLEGYHIDPSQGTHFFQNLTSFGVTYFTINPYQSDGAFDIDYLNDLQAEHETTYIRHISFEQPIVIKVDGRKNRGVVLKPTT